MVVLLFRAESHNIFDSRTVVPTTIEVFGHKNLPFRHFSSSWSGPLLAFLTASGRSKWLECGALAPLWLQCQSMELFVTREGAILKRFDERAAHHEMLCLKSPKSYLDRVSTGRGRDLVKPWQSKIVRKILHADH